MFLWPTSYNATIGGEPIQTDCETSVQHWLVDTCNKHENWQEEVGTGVSESPPHCPNRK